MASVYHGRVFGPHEQCKGRNAVLCEPSRIPVPTICTIDVQSYGLWVGQHCNGVCFVDPGCPWSDCLVVLWCKAEDSSAVDLLILGVRRGKGLADMMTAGVLDVVLWDSKSLVEMELHSHIFQFNRILQSVVKPEPSAIIFLYFLPLSNFLLCLSTRDVCQQGVV